MESAERVHFEIEERNRSGAVVRRLGGGVDDDVRPQLLHKFENAFAISNVQRVVPVVRNLIAEARQRPARVALGPEEHSAMVAIDTGNLEALEREEAAHLTSDQAA